MSTADYRKCAKCDRTRIEDMTVKYYRFPEPGSRNLLKCRAWAVYCWPDKDWTSIESLKKLNKRCKVLCSRHFSALSFNNIEKQQLGRFAVPDSKDVCELMNERENVYKETVVDPVISTIEPIASSSSGLPAGASTGTTVHLSSNGTAVSQSIGPTVGPLSVPRVSPPTGLKVGLLSGPGAGLSSGPEFGLSLGPKVGPQPEVRLDEPQVIEEEVGPFSWQKPTAVLDCDDDDIIDDDIINDDITDHIVDSGQQPQKVPSGRDEVADVTSPPKPCVCESAPCECVSAVYKHEGYCCNVCDRDITGFRYVCVECSDFDLCSSCEYKQAHCHHYVLRVPPHRTQSEVLEKLRTIRRALLMDAIVTVPQDTDGASIEIKEEEEYPIAVDNTTSYEEGDQHCLEQSTDPIGVDSNVQKVIPTACTADPNLNKDDLNILSFDPNLHNVDSNLHKVDPNIHNFDPSLQELDPILKDLNMKITCPESIKLFITRSELKENINEICTNSNPMGPDLNTVELHTKRSQEDPNTINVKRSKIDPLQSTPKINDGSQTVLLYSKTSQENPSGVHLKRLKKISKRDLIKSQRRISETNKEMFKIVECVKIVPMKAKVVQNSTARHVDNPNSQANTQISKDYTIFPESRTKRAEEPKMSQNQGMLHDQNLSMYEDVDVLEPNLLDEEDLLLQSKYGQMDMTETIPIQESIDSIPEVNSSDEIIVVNEATLELLQGMTDAYVSMERLSEEEISAYVKTNRLKNVASKINLSRNK